MGPVGQVVKILFYMFLGAELIFSIAIYAMSTVLLCSRIHMPQHILLHGAIALFLSIVTLSVIHRGFQAVGHDCPFHLYWFAAIFIVLLLVQFLFELFGMQESSKEVWHSRSLPITDVRNLRMISTNFTKQNEEETEYITDQNYPLKYSKQDSKNKMAYRIPTREELEARKRKLYGITEPQAPRAPPTSRPREPNEVLVDLSERKYHRPSYHSRPRTWRTRAKIPDDDSNANVPKPRKAVTPSNSSANDTEEKLTNTPLVLVLHGYSFILKMVCIAMSILTGFLYQLEYI